VVEKNNTLNLRSRIRNPENKLTPSASPIYPVDQQNSATRQLTLFPQIAKLLYSIKSACSSRPRAWARLVSVTRGPSPGGICGAGPGPGSGKAL